MSIAQTSDKPMHLKIDSMTSSVTASQGSQQLCQGRQKWGLKKACRKGSAELGRFSYFGLAPARSVLVPCQLYMEHCDSNGACVMPDSPVSSYHSTDNLYAGNSPTCKITYSATQQNLFFYLLIHTVWLERTLPQSK